jgi:hypothetical protein
MPDSERSGIEQPWDDVARIFLEGPIWRQTGAPKRSYERQFGKKMRRGPNTMPEHSFL